MGFLTPAEWQEYKDIINEFNLDDSNQEDITWRRLTSNLNRFGEDDGVITNDVNIKGLIQYNYFRAWPANRSSVSGELDKESLLLWLNIEYLRTNGWLTASNQFAFRPGEDRFIINGEVFKATGNSQAAQASDEPLLVFIILKAEETDTGELVYE